MDAKKVREITLVETEKVRAPGEEGYVLLDGKTLTYVNASWVLGTEHKIWAVKEEQDVAHQETETAGPPTTISKNVEAACPVVGGGDFSETKVNPDALKVLLELLALRDDNIVKRLEALEEK